MSQRRRSLRQRVGAAGRRRLLALVLINLAGMGVLFATAEGALRIRDSLRQRQAAVKPKDFQNYPYTNRDQSYGQHRAISHMEYDPFLGYVPKASDSDAGYRTNGQRFRYDEELSKEKPASELRIFVTGGSTAWGAGVRQDQLYTVLAERRFEADYRELGVRVRVISAGVGAWVTTQELGWLHSHVVEYSPDIVVMFTGANDVYNGYSGNNHLRNQDFLQIRRALAQSSFRPLDPGLDPARLAAEYPPRWADYRSKILYTIDAFLYGRSRRGRGPVERDLSFEPDQALGYTLRNLHAARDLGRRFGFDLVLYLQPHLAVTAKELGDWEERRMVMAEERYPGWPAYVRSAYALYRGRLAADAAREGYLYVDADEAIAEERESVFVDDFHLGDRGNEHIARHLHAVLSPLVAQRVDRWTAPAPRPDEGGRP